MTPPRSASRRHGVLKSLGLLFNLDVWTIRRARGRFGAALGTMLAVTALYAIGWIIVFVGAGPLDGRHDAMPWYLTVPMVVVEVPWVWSWVPTDMWSVTRTTLAGYRHLGLGRWAARVVYIVGGLLAIIQLGLCFATMFATFASSG